jgi:hypothetical protein
MSVIKRGTKWQVYVTLSGGRRVREAYDTQMEAIAREAALKVDSHLGRDITPPDRAAEGMTLGELRDLTLSVIWKDDKSVDTTRSRSSLVVAHFGANKPVSSITTRDVDAWVLTLEQAGNGREVTMTAMIAAIYARTILVLLCCLLTVATSASAGARSAGRPRL